MNNDNKTRQLNPLKNEEKKNIKKENKNTKTDMQVYMKISTIFKI